MKTTNMKIILSILIISFFSINLNAKELYPVLIDDQMAYIDKNGNVEIKTPYRPNIRTQQRELGNNEIDYFEFPSYSYFSEGYACVQDLISFLDIIDLKTNYHLINKNGESIYKSDYVIDQFKCGFARNNIEIKGVGNKIMGIEHNYINQNKYHFLDVMLPENLEFVSYFSECYALVKDDKYGYIDSSGKNVIECQFRDAGDFNEGLAFVEINGRYGYINKSGDLVIEPKFQKASDFNSGRARVFAKGRYRFIDRNGEYISGSDYEYKDALDFSEGFACVKSKYMYKFINTAGELAFQTKTPYPTYFSSGLATVSMRGKWTYIDTKGDEQFDVVFDFAKAFDRELAMVWYKDNIYYINKEGNLVWNISEQITSEIDRSFKK